ncbi:recombinase family protein [uncultured Clostridium sp.]
MLQLAKTGRWLGGQEPFGFKAKRISYIDENFNERSLMVLSPIKEESELIEKIYLKYIELQSITQVVNWLQDNKYKGKNGGEWVTTQVQRILSSPLYVKSSTKTHSYIKSLGINVFGEANGNGYLTYNKTRKMVIDRDITEWIYATAKHPGIIDDDKWLMVQTILTKNKHKKVKRLGTGSSNSALLTGILKCSKCGSNMIIKQGHKSKKEEGKRYDYYVCSKKDNSRGKKCDNKNIRTDRLDNIVIGQVNAYNKETLYSNLSKLLEESKDDTNINNKLSSIKLEIKENETKISNLIKQLSSAPNEIVSGYIMQEVSKLSAEINKLKSELENIKEDKKTYNYDLENLKLIVKMLKEFEENFEITDDITKKRLMIQTILNDVTWNGETLEAKITMFGEDKKKL